ncbi:4046_t:CDS:2 [Gigaspora rosea]|nr:4046_t:CDS:2 [Gigaspora rosea]
MYSECSRLFCTSQKIDYDAVKLWRETNDGPLLRLTVLIRDGASVDRYYHLHESEIPVQYSDSYTSERQKENSSTVGSDSD